MKHKAFMLVPVLGMALALSLSMVGCGRQKSHAGFYLLRALTLEGESYDEAMLRDCGLYGASYLMLEEDGAGRFHGSPPRREPSPPRHDEKGGFSLDIFDQLKNKAQSAARSAVQPARAAAAGFGSQRETFTFAALPGSAAELRVLPEAAMDTPFQTAALAVCALCAFSADQSAGVEMLNFLRGPRPMNGQDISFVRDRFRGNRAYIIFSHFAGSMPESGYTPTLPYTLEVFSDARSGDQENMARLFVRSGGADSPRPVTLRLAKDGKWYLWEYSSLLLDIRPPAASDPWA